MKQNRFLQSNRLSKYDTGASLIIPEDNESIDDLYNELNCASKFLEMYGYEVDCQINTDENYIFYRFIKISNKH